LKNSRINKGRKKQKTERGMRGGGKGGNGGVFALEGRRPEDGRTGHGGRGRPVDA